VRLRRCGFSYSKNKTVTVYYFTVKTLPAISKAFFNETLPPKLPASRFAVRNDGQNKGDAL
jgi:hypothetical protein